MQKTCSLSTILCLTENSGLYAFILIVLLFHNFNSINLFILNFLFIGVTIALMQSSVHSVRFSSYICIYGFLHSKTLLVLAFCGPLRMCATDLQLMNTDMNSLGQVRLLCSQSAVDYAFVFIPK